MAVFTPLTLDDLAPWLTQYALGSPVALRGIAAGIENSNFFLTTRNDEVRQDGVQHGGLQHGVVQHGVVQHEYVLTIFEKLSAEELPFYLDLTAHLSSAGVPCPGPVKGRDGRNFHLLKGKPAAIVRRLPGQSHLRPSNAERAQVGAMLAFMHLAGQNFSGANENPRGPHWWAVTAPLLQPYLDAPTRALLDDELRFQAAHRHDALPRGPVHADLFRDNVLFEQEADGASRLGGFIDFYFAGRDCLLFDVAVCVNDWCIAHDDSGAAVKGELIAGEALAFLAAYHQVRPLSPAERAAWPVMLRAAALRFWLSRLYDFHLPRAGEMITPHDPGHFERILRLRREAAALPWIT